MRAGVCGVVIPMSPFLITPFRVGRSVNRSCRPSDAPPPSVLPPQDAMLQWIRCCCTALCHSPWGAVMSTGTCPSRHTRTCIAACRVNHRCLYTDEKPALISVPVIWRQCHSTCLVAALTSPPLRLHARALPLFLPHWASHHWHCPWCLHLHPLQPHR